MCVCVCVCVCISVCVCYKVFFFSGIEIPFTGKKNVFKD